MELTLKINQEDAQLLLDVLANHPYQHVYLLINSIQKQAHEQLKNEKQFKLFTEGKEEEL